ncbi:MAG: hypothetical protein AAFZ18_15565 [Myxococcota bacterium]
MLLPTGAKGSEVRQGILGKPGFAELLISLLRDDRDAELQLDLDDEPRNRIVFRSGLPVVVELPDLGPTLISLLVDEGNLEAEQGRAVARDADREGATGSEVLEAQQLLGPSELQQARRRRARAQLVRLVDLEGVAFRVRDGRPHVDPGRSTLIDPLDVLHAGFRRSPDGRAALRYLPAVDARLELTSTYPVGFDPFGLGPEREAELIGGFSLEGLSARGWEVGELAAAVGALLLSGMAELTPAPEGPGEALEGAHLIADLVEPTPEPDDSGSGLKVLRRSRARRPTPTVVPALDEQGPQTETAESVEDQEVSARLSLFEGKSYLQVLRLGVHPEAAQLERAYRFLSRRAEAEGAEAGPRALSGLYREAYHCLRHPDLRERYLQGTGRNRNVLEAERKVLRVVKSLGEAQDAEARYLARWAARLAPWRRELSALAPAVDFLTGRGGLRAEVLSELSACVEREPDPSLGHLVAALHARRGRMTEARRALAEAAPLDLAFVRRFVPSRPA